MGRSNRNVAVVPRLALGAAVAGAASACVVALLGIGCTSTPDDIPDGVLGDDASYATDSEAASDSALSDAAEAGDAVDDTPDAAPDDASDVGLDGG
jgi:hypothetical protein